VSVLEPLAPDLDARLARRNPLAKVAAAFVVTLGLLVTLDPLTPAIVLAVELAVVPLTGVRLSTLARRTWPLLLGVAGVAVANLLFAEGGWRTAVAVSLRLLAVSLPGILALATTDPLDLADALVQRAKVPARFAYGALVSLRLLPVLAADWHTTAWARRARGLDAGRSPVRAARLFSSQVFALLVQAVRRGVRMAAAMDARGFDVRGPRTVARPQPMHAADWALIAGAAALVVAATAVSVAVGQWRLPFA
jgi:energy-coupling factor transport system permease protein